MQLCTAVYSTARSLGHHNFCSHTLVTTSHPFHKNFTSHHVTFNIAPTDPIETSGGQGSPRRLVDASMSRSNAPQQPISAP